MENKYEQFKQYPTEPGWYCIGWDREDKEEQESFGPDFGEILLFDGKNWFTEDNELKLDIWVPSLQMKVGMGDGVADYYVKQ
jgi:hypothetical protein